MAKEQKFYNKDFGNGVTLIAEEIEGVSSASLSILFPTGCAVDPLKQEGLSILLVELLFKGAGNYDSKQLAAEFDKIGAHRSHSAGIEVSSFSCSLLAENLLRAIELFSLVITSPNFPEQDLDPVRELALQDILALEDEPASKIMNVLAQKFYPYPFGRSQYGTEEGLRSTGISQIKDFYQSEVKSGEIIVSVAGQFNWKELEQKVAQCFSSWKAAKKRLEVPPLLGQKQYHHLEQETQQVQIAFAYPSISFDHPDYYVARVSNSVLSGGMAGRLFIEVREKRGLVYRVGSSHSAARKRGAVFAYAGTTPDNAQTTLDVMLKEMKGLQNGVSADELKRAKTELKSSLIMHSETSSVRASALVNDWWNLGRLRQLEEVKAGIDKVTNEDIMRFQKAFPVDGFTLITLGPKKVEV